MIDVRERTILPPASSIQGHQSHAEQPRFLRQKADAFHKCGQNFNCFPILHFVTLHRTSKWSLRRFFVKFIDSWQSLD